MRGVKTLLKTIRNVKDLLKEAGMQFKLKALVGFNQCLAAIPDVFDVRTPPGLEDYTRWINVLRPPVDWHNVAYRVCSLRGPRVRRMANSKSQFQDEKAVERRSSQEPSSRARGGATHPAHDAAADVSSGAKHCHDGVQNVSM
eukprot:4244736-Prymnesium_polylepis.4